MTSFSSGCLVVDNSVHFVKCPVRLEGKNTLSIMQLYIGHKVSADIETLTQRSWLKHYVQLMCTVEVNFVTHSLSRNGILTKTTKRIIQSGTFQQILL